MGASPVSAHPVPRLTLDLPNTPQAPSHRAGRRRLFFHRLPAPGHLQPPSPTPQPPGGSDDRGQVLPELRTQGQTGPARGDEEALAEGPERSGKRVEKGWKQERWPGLALGATGPKGAVRVLCQERQGEGRGEDKSRGSCGTLLSWATAQHNEAALTHTAAGASGEERVIWGLCPAGASLLQPCQSPAA